jgi:hypothetical protein
VFVTGSGRRPAEWREGRCAMKGNNSLKGGNTKGNNSL